MFTVLAASSRARYEADGPAYLESFNDIFKAYQAAVNSGYDFWLIECDNTPI